MLSDNLYRFYSLNDIGWQLELLEFERRSCCQETLLLEFKNQTLNFIDVWFDHVSKDCHYEPQNWVEGHSL